MKHISTLLGLGSILVMSALACSAVWLADYYIAPRGDVTVPSTSSMESHSNTTRGAQRPAKASMRVTDQAVLDAVIHYEGIDGLSMTQVSDGSYSGKVPGGGYSADIAIGDLDGDGRDDAFVYFVSCGASCGQDEYFVVLDRNGGTLDVDPVDIGYYPDENRHGEPKAITSVNIQKGVLLVGVTAYDANDSISSIMIHKYRLVGRTLEKVDRSVH